MRDDRFETPRTLFSAAERRALLAILFIAGAGMRLYHLGDPPMDFHPVRQYRSALIARGWWREGRAGEFDAAQVETARLNREREGILEPPIVETLAVAGYRIAGRESLAIPRALATAFWMMGGVFLYLIAVRIAGSEGALLSVAFYLLLPFGVSAGRSFQPDPLAIALMLGGTWAIFRYLERETAARLAAAAALAGGAMLVKPVAAFPLWLGMFGALAATRGAAGALKEPRLYIFGVASAAPMLIYYLYGIFIAGFLGGQASGSFMPELMARGFFWKGWLHIIRSVVGYPALVAGLLGTIAAGGGPRRGGLAGLWAGYFVMGLVFTLHIHTHDYYSLMLVPIVALGLAPVGRAMFGAVATAGPAGVWRAALWGVILLGVALAARESRWRMALPDFGAEVARAEAIGEAVEHGANVLILDTQFGKVIQYHGEFSGRIWPRPTDGGPLGVTAWDEGAVEGVFAGMTDGAAADFFVLTDFDALALQPGLVPFLDARFGAIARGEGALGYVVYDLRGGER